MLVAVAVAVVVVVVVVVEELVAASILTPSILTPPQTLLLLLLLWRSTPYCLSDPKLGKPDELSLSYKNEVRGLNNASTSLYITIETGGH